MFTNDDPLNATDPHGLESFGWNPISDAILVTKAVIKKASELVNKAYCRSSGGGRGGLLGGWLSKQAGCAQGGGNHQGTTFGLGVNPIAPVPPGFNPNSWTIAKPSRSSNPYDSYFDPQGGEFRWHPQDAWHDESHWDYKPSEPWNAPWETIPEVGIGGAGGEGEIPIDG